LGGEGAISSGDVVELQFANYAQQEGALMVALEHRFYGQSQPFADLSTPNLAYLSSQQALADAANFLVHFKQSYPTAGDVIVFGGSYPGALAAWFRLKYPHLVKASIASSAPVLAVLDMTSYLDVVEESLTKLAGITCDKNIQLATNLIQTMLSNSTGRQMVSKYFNTCEQIQTDLDVANFMSTIMGFFMETVQYNTDLPISIEIPALCNIMDNETMDLVSRYAAISNRYQQGQCLEISYNNMIALLQNVTIGDETGVGIRQWTYQTCAQFGYFQSTDSPNQPFGNLVPVSFFTGICNDAFGFDWLPRIDETNGIYGGKHPGGSRILFVNGGLDPWSSLSVTKTISPDLPAIFITGTSHCANMFPARAVDPPSLAIAQGQIAMQIHEWLEAE